MRRGTLAQGLFFRIAPTILIIIVGIGALAFHSATRKINMVYDAQLIDNAGILWMMEADDFSEGDQSPSPKEIDSQSAIIRKQWTQNEDADDYADARMFRIWKAGKIVVYSDTTLPASVPRQKGGFSNVVFKGQEWRLYDLSVPTYKVSIEVGEKMSLRRSLVTDILLDLFLPLLFLFPIVGGLIWIGISSGLSTVRALVRQIKGRSPDNLSAVAVETLPRDLEPLVSSINQLLSQLERSLTMERRFSDDAAHQLRTPLAGFKLQLQMLEDADTEKEKRSILNGLLASNERASKLVSQLLTMARVSHEKLTISGVPLYEVTASVIADLAAFAERKQISITLTGEEGAMARGDDTMLRLMIGNIIDNALKYSPESGEVGVAISDAGGKWRIAVTDTGPGIPEEHRVLAFQRFYRVDSPREEGSGLGLAIVAEIVQRLAGEISLRTPENGRGLLVEVFMPRRE